jgi:hypothetical protein
MTCETKLGGCRTGPLGLMSGGAPVTMDNPLGQAAVGARIGWQLSSHRRSRGMRGTCRSGLIAIVVLFQLRCLHWLDAEKKDDGKDEITQTVGGLNEE